MADTAVAITAGTGTNIDTRTEASNGNHRQVVVLGDPSTNAGVAPVDVTKGLSVTLSTKIAGEDLTNDILKVNQVFSPLNITTNTTTVVHSGAGLFAGFTVNNVGFTTAGTITIYDNTAGSGTKIGTWTIPLMPPGTILLATTFFPPVVLNAIFATGLTIVTATTAPAADITVLYR